VHIRIGSVTLLTLASDCRLPLTGHVIINDRSSCSQYATVAAVVGIMNIWT